MKGCLYEISRNSKHKRAVFRFISESQSPTKQENPHPPLHQNLLFLVLLLSGAERRSADNQTPRQSQRQREEKRGRRRKEREREREVAKPNPTGEKKSRIYR